MLVVARLIHGHINGQKLGLRLAPRVFGRPVERRNVSCAKSFRLSTYTVPKGVSNMATSGHERYVSAAAKARPPDAFKDIIPLMGVCVSHL